MKKTIDFHFETPNESLGYLLWQATMKWQREANQALSVVGVTHTQFAILSALAWLLRTSDNVTQKDIAESSKTDRMMVSKILRTLEKNGVIERKEHETDTRAKCVFLTDKGVDVLQKAIEIKNKSNDTFFKNITDKSTFSKELQQIIT
ncbi:MarR family winged helix-turn-helix transcriptional regulator [Olleya sp. Bg11-27]|uniref:MarR family winged helix-turn-helix transcriptional regulator n=1 Tax=Olleya sp. Bg11-27 TaxID=2058135 RepID=UPI000C30E679|nr:MarR family transcriptional regulator [Olleya sp. Bg11-27]AUC76187.1 MarR family transcriptional regulator [Olleya sp. Bg11-27]